MSAPSVRTLTTPSIARDRRKTFSDLADRRLCEAQQGLASPRPCGGTEGGYYYRYADGLILLRAALASVTRDMVGAAHMRHRLADELAQDIQVDIVQLINVQAGAARAVLAQLA